VLAVLGASAFPAVVLDLAVCANKVWPAVLAPGPLLLVFAYLAASAFLAICFDLAVWAYLAASAFLAGGLDPAVWAEPSASAFLAIVLELAVEANDVWLALHALVY
jgi:hypothetical protein